MQSPEMDKASVQENARDRDAQANPEDLHWSIESFLSCAREILQHDFILKDQGADFYETEDWNGGERLWGRAFLIKTH